MKAQQRDEWIRSYMVVVIRSIRMHVSRNYSPLVFHASQWTLTAQQYLQLRNDMIDDGKPFSGLHVWWLLSVNQTNLVSA